MWYIRSDLVEIDNGSDVMNTTSHRVYQTGEGERGRERPRTSENQATGNQARGQKLVLR